MKNKSFLSGVLTGMTVSALLVAGYFTGQSVAAMSAATEALTDLAGEHIFESQCMDCHLRSDFDETDKDTITATVNGMVEDNGEHPPVVLTENDAALLVEYLTK
jgi:hypothetical protein